MAKWRRQHGGDAGNKSISTQPSPATATQTQFPPSPPLPFGPPPSPFSRLNCTAFPDLPPCFQRPPRPTKITSQTTILTSTISTNFISTVTAISFSITQVPVPSSTISSSPASLQDTASSSKITTITLILAAVIIFLSLVIIAILFCLLSHRQRSRNQQSTEFSPGPDPSTLPRGRRRMGVAQFGEVDQHSLADPAGNAMYTTAALNSNPFTRPEVQQAGSPTSRPPEERPGIPTWTGLPTINILPNTPPVRRQEGDGDVSPLTPPGQARARRLSIYNHALRDEADRERYIAEASNAPRLGLPVVEPARSPSEHRRSSEEDNDDDNDDDTIASDIIDLGRGLEPRQPGVLHSTRASSGVFPEQEGVLGVGSSRVSWDEGVNTGWRDSVRDPDVGNGRGKGGPMAD